MLTFVNITTVLMNVNMGALLRLVRQPPPRRAEEAGW
jgi:hypothetical protein